MKTLADIKAAALAAMNVPHVPRDVIEGSEFDAFQRDMERDFCGTNGCRAIVDATQDIEVMDLLAVLIAKAAELRATSSGKPWGAIRQEQGDLGREVLKVLDLITEVNGRQHFSRVAASCDDANQYDYDNA